MKQTGVSAAVLLAAALLGFAGGCGDDKSTGSQLETGDLNDPEFLAAVQAFDQTNLDDVAKQMYREFQFVSSAVLYPGVAEHGRTLPGQAAQVTSVWYDAATGYWHRQNVIPLMVELDSIQFMTASGPVPRPSDDSAMTISMGRRMFFGSNVDTVESRTCLCTFSWPGAADPVMTINGTKALKAAASVTSEDPLQAWDVTAIATVTGVALDLSSDPDCARSGSSTTVADLQTEWKTGDTVLTFSGIWHIDVTYGVDSTLIVMDNGTTRWTYAEYCTTSKSGAGEAPAEFLRPGQ